MKIHYQVGDKIRVASDKAWSPERKDRILIKAGTEGVITQIMNIETMEPCLLRIMFEISEGKGGGGIIVETVLHTCSVKPAHTLHNRI